MKQHRKVSLFFDCIHILERQYILLVSKIYNHIDDELYWPLSKPNFKITSSIRNSIKENEET